MSLNPPLPGCAAGYHKPDCGTVGCGGCAPASRYSIEVTVTAFDEYGNAIGFEGREVWTGSRAEEALRVLPQIREDFDDPKARIFEYVGNRLTREFD